MSILLILATLAVFYMWAMTKLFKTLKHADVGLFTAQANSNQWTLTNGVKRVLDIVFVFLLLVLVAWPVAIAVMAFSHVNVPTWGVDIAAYAGFSIDVGAIADLSVSGLRHPEISGKSIVNLDVSSVFAWYLFAGTSLISACAALYVVFLMRQILFSIQKGTALISLNANRIKHIGIIIISWNIIMPIIQYFGWGQVINDIQFSSPAIQLYPAFEINLLGLIVGFLIVIFSSVMMEASVMKSEQELTI